MGRPMYIGELEHGWSSDDDDFGQRLNIVGKAVSIVGGRPMRGGGACIHLSHEDRKEAAAALLRGGPGWRSVIAGLKFSVLTRAERRRLWRYHRCGAAVAQASIDDHTTWHGTTDPGAAA